MLTFKDRVVIVTGGANGIGRYIADEFRNQGAVVYEGSDIEELTNLIHNIEHKLYVKTINKLINKKF